MLIRRVRLAGIQYLFSFEHRPSAAPNNARRLSNRELERLLIEHHSHPLVRALLRARADRLERARHTSVRGVHDALAVGDHATLVCHALPTTPPRLTPGVRTEELSVSRPPPAFDPTPMFDEQQHWLEIQLLGEDDNGIPGMLCAVTLANGQVIERRTDRFGLVRIEGLTSTSPCSVSFPALDTEAWERL